MNRYFLLTLILCFSSGSITFAQGGFLEQLGRELGIPELQQHGGGQQGSGEQPQIRGALPSEGGHSSGGGDTFYNPGGDGGFWLEDGGRQPSQPSGQPFYSDRQPYNPSGQPYYRDGQPDYSNVQPYPGRRNLHSRDTNYTHPGLPSSPVMSNQYVVIRCPASTIGSITYTLASKQGRFGFTMSAGQEQHFRVGTNWTIGYNDGSQQRLYKLEGGKTYTINRKSNNHWQLYFVKSAGS